MAILKDAEGNEVEVLTKDEVSAMVGGAIRSQLQKALKPEDLVKQVKDGLTDTLKEHVDQAIKTYDETKAAEKQKQQKQSQGGGEPPKLEDSPAFKAMQRQLEDQKKALEKAQAERDTERARTRESTLRSQTLEALATAGLNDQTRARLAAGHLIDAAKRVRWDDAEKELLYVENGETLPLKDGLEGWMKGDEAKIYLPARGSTGSGDEPARSGSPRKRDNPFDISDAELGQAVMEELG